MNLTYTIHYVPNGHKCQSGMGPITEILQDFLRRSCPVTLRINVGVKWFVLHHNPSPITFEQALGAWKSWEWKHLIATKEQRRDYNRRALG